MIKRIHSTLFLCKDLGKTSRFYQQIGFPVEVSDDVARIIFGDYRLTFIEEDRAAIQNDIGAKKGVGMSIFFEVENVDDFYQMLKENQITPVSEPEGRVGGKRKFAVQDPDGYTLVFFTKVKD